MSDDYGPDLRAAARTVTRMTISAEFSGGEVITVTAERPEKAELEVTVIPDLPPVAGGPDALLLAKLVTPPPAEVAVRLKSEPGRPVTVTVTAGSRYDCGVPGCPSPYVRGSRAEVMAHVEAHALMREWTEAGCPDCLPVSSWCSRR